MDKVVAVTGASSGIGLATAKWFAARGYAVYNLARRPDPDGVAVHIPTDVTDAAAVRAAFAAIDAAHDGLDVLVNNAGYGISGAAEFTDYDEARRLFDVNFFGQLRCAQAALPLLRKRRGRIVNVSSVAAIFAIPFQSFYSACKAASNALSLALDNEARPFGVRVVAVMPGDTHTGFTDARQKSEAGSALYGETIAKSVGVMEHDERGGMPPEAVARVVFKAATGRNPKPLRCVGVQYKLFALIFRLLPTRAVNFLVGKLYMKK